MPEQLTQSQIDQYNAQGYLVLERQIPDDWLAKIRAEIARFEEEAKSLTASNDRLDLEDTHTPDTPRLRRIKLPHTTSEVMRDLMTRVRLLFSELILQVEALWPLM